MGQTQSTPLSVFCPGALAQQVSPVPDDSEHRHGEGSGDRLRGVCVLRVNLNQLSVCLLVRFAFVCFCVMLNGRAKFLFMQMFTLQFEAVGDLARTFFLLFPLLTRFYSCHTPSAGCGYAERMAQQQLVVSVTPNSSCGSAVRTAQQSFDLFH